MARSNEHGTGGSRVDERTPPCLVDRRAAQQVERHAERAELRLQFTRAAANETSGHETSESDSDRREQTFR